ncbi:hypothetical protein PAH44_00660 [Klebsiella pneumoniae]|uniref:hypothetical protein n=1 Tax=Klebsiella pneumoniae TaxID=573 RepID=UPI0028460443|nr:hypothetical protein [Klebsiella pneumoniae]MDR4735849.1 hypothetical protein [Klebsiella pneumoniae]MDR4756584.1 hypothetical protein [Klebsiella pneumoniae]MDR4767134.1 hypothetical protein [Klebsiella pneumoniae]MDR4772388.1 hypothetical protein [Klebsiella pneumoniae]MDR4777806.1 hypothetical protein [Klebsiella pneumoniae]
MMVENDTSSVEYQLSTSTGPFAIPFYFIENGHISAWLYTENSDGGYDETTLTLDTDYILTGAGDSEGGTLTLVETHDGATLLIARTPDATQLTSYVATGKFPATSHERALDKLTMLIQQIYWWWDDLPLKRPNIFANFYHAKNRFIKYLKNPVDEQDAATKNYADGLYDGAISHADEQFKRTLRVPESSVNILPSINGRKKKILAFDDNGNPIAVLPESGSAADVLINLGSNEEGQGASLVGLEQGGTVQSAITWCDMNMYPELDRTGSTNMLPQINAIIEAAKDKGIYKITDTSPPGSVYRIDGSQDLVFYGHTEFGDAKFHFAKTWKGQVVLKDPANEIITYDSSTSAGAALLAKINGSSSQSRLAQSLQIDGLVDDTTLNSCMCIFDSGIPAYYSRGVVKNYEHIGLISTRGLISDALYYSLTGMISSVRALRIKPNTTIVKLPMLDFTDRPHAISVLMQGCSRYEVWGPNVSDRNLTDTGSEYVLSMHDCFDCEIRWGYDVHPNVSFNGKGSTSLVSSYTLNFNYCLDCKFINQRSMGFGWGSTAGEVCSNTTFIFCKLNRIDFHNPMQGTTKIIDCDMGNNGISMCAMGRIEMIRPHWKLETLNAPYTPTGVTLIKSRDDIGGFVDGDIYIENAVVSGGFTYNDNNSIATYLIGGMINLASTNPGGTTTLPEGSPVVPRLFRDITIKGMKHLRRYSTDRYTRFIYSNLPQYLKHPESITLDDFDYFCDQPLVFGFGNWLDTYYTDDTTSSPMAVDVTCHITINRGAFAGLSFAGTGNKQNLSVKLNQVRDLRYGKKGVAIVANTRGVYEITDTDVTSLSTIFNSSQPTVPNVIKLNGGTFRLFDNSVMPMAANDTVYHDVSASNVTFLGDFSASTVTATNLNLAKWFRLSGCSYQTVSGARVPYLLLYTGNVGTSAITIGVPVRSGNAMLTQSIYNSLTTTDTFQISNMSGNFSRKLYNGADGGYFLNISITGNRALINTAKASETALLRQILLAA